MALSPNDLLFLDCQTTGMRPPNGRMLELAWAIGIDSEPESYLIELPKDEEIPKRVSELTGIQTADLKDALPESEVFAKFQATLHVHNPAIVAAVIHYAQFERPFLLDFYNRFSECNEIPFPVICSHQLTKRIFPGLPSQNIRGAAGFFGESMDGIKRAPSHVRATQRIWLGLAPELEKLELDDLNTLNAWLKTPVIKSTTRYEYRLDKLKRLELPDAPGIYRMIAKNGTILYVGKATSLKSRVNSYFRGKKGRDKRKLEMMAQVWDLQVTHCGSPLEAALLESDEIKRLDPPYNVALKRGRRHLVFYNQDFSIAHTAQTPEFKIGPFRNSNWIEHLRCLARSTKQAEFEQVFFTPIPEEDLRNGFALFCAQQNLRLDQLQNVRSLLALALKLVKDHVEAEPQDEEVAEEDEDAAKDLTLTPEQIAEKFERLLKRAGNEYLRTKKLTRLLNSKIVLKLKSGPRQLNFRHSHLSDVASAPRSRQPWQDLTIDDFDRMSILLSELAKYKYQIEYILSPPP